MPTNTTIAQQASELKNTLAAQLPEGVRAALAADQASAAARGTPDNVARPGDMLPDGELLDVHGAPTSATSQRHGRPAVVVFTAAHGARTATLPSRPISNTCCRC